MARPSKLADAEIAAALAERSEWSRTGDEIARTFECASFPDAIAFVVRIGTAADAANHHPDVTLTYPEVSVSITTHDAGGLTDLDNLVLLCHQHHHDHHDRGLELPHRDGRRRLTATGWAHSPP